MLILQQITKDYRAGGETIHALKGIDLAFQPGEFVAVLGPSGCGKTTLLNIIGGLDRYTTGDLSINGRSTAEFKDADWDAYRNHSIGFVFQTYHLIPHQTVLRNVELALTLSGVGKAERRQRAKAALERVGLLDQLGKRPNQMSGGQMQRVAIARALINDPDILLADEPTGALDTETSVQIMEILKEISKEKLVIMVTHNPDLAEQYATRTVRLLDGQLIGDTAPCPPEALEAAAKAPPADKGPRKPSMSFGTALSLSLNNLLTKKTRTLLTAFAGSIGIVGIALILSLSNGIQNYIDRVQEDALSTYPLHITSQTMDMNTMIASMSAARPEGTSHELDRVYSNTILSDMADNMMNMQFRTNDLASFLAYLESEESGAAAHVSGIRQDYGATLQIYTENVAGDLQQVNPSPIFDKLMGTFYNTETLGSMSAFGSAFSSGVDIWQELLDNEALMATQYDVLAGRWPEKYDEVVLLVDEHNEINDMFLYSLGIKDPKEMETLLEASIQGEIIDADAQSWSYEELLALRFRLVLPTDCYKYDEQSGLWLDQRDNAAYMRYLSSISLPLQIVGIIRPSENAAASALGGAIGYRGDLTDYYLNAIAESAIVRRQLAAPETDVFLNLPYDDGSFPEPSDAEKAAAFTAWSEAQDSLTLGRIYTEIASTPSDEELAAMVAEALAGLDKNAMVDAMAEGAASQMGMSVETIRSYLEAMSEADLKEYLAAAMTEELKASYAASAAEGIGSLSSDELARLFEMQISILDEAGLARLYDAYMPPAVSDSSLEKTLSSLGYNDRSQPESVSLYAATFQDKDALVDIIETYNQRMRDEGREDRVIAYTDYVGLLMSSVTTIVQAISYVLVAFVSISLVVSSIMIGIITYISVLERTKEIGILRAMGASKKDIARVFNAETLIVGFSAGALGIIVTVLLNIPISLIVQHLTGIPYLRALLPAAAGAVLVVVSMLLTLVAGLIPARVAAKRDPVEALRTE